MGQYRTPAMIRQHRTDMDITVIILFVTNIIALDLVLTTYVQGKISDACHGVQTQQTTNVLECPDQLSVCLTDVYYYQWHIGDNQCPHTISKSVHSRCCRRDPEKCFWAADFDHVRALQRICGGPISGNSRCELHSSSPHAIRPLCYVDNVRLSTTSSVRSIHYICVRGRCPELTTLLSNQTGSKPEVSSTAISSPRTPGNGRDTKASSTYNGFDNPKEHPGTLDKGITTGKTARKTDAVTLGPVIVIRPNKQKIDEASNANDSSPSVTTIGTARITAIDEPKTTDAGAIVGGIFGVAAVCFVIAGIFLYRRWVKKKDDVRQQETPVRTRTNVDIVHTCCNPEFPEYVNCAGSIDSSNSRRSEHHYASIESSGGLKTRPNSKVPFQGAVSRSSLYGNIPRRSSAHLNRPGFVATTSGPLSMHSNRSSSRSSGYDHMQGPGPSLSEFRRSDYDHLPSSLGTNRSHQILDVSGPSLHKSTAVASGIYDQLDRRANTSDQDSADDSSNYNTLQMKWKK